MDELQKQELLRKLAEASLAKQGGKEVIETDRPVFGQTGQNVKFRSSLPSESAPQEEPVDYAAMNNPEAVKKPNERVQQFIDKLKQQNEQKNSPSREPASEKSTLEVSINPAEKEFKIKRSSESLNRSIEHLNTLPDDIEARGQAIDDIMSEGQLSPEDEKKLIEWANEDYKRLSGRK